MARVKLAMIVLNFVVASQSVWAQGEKFAAQMDPLFRLPTADAMLQELAGKKLGAAGRVRTLNFPADSETCQLMEKQVNFHFPNYTLRDALRAASDQNRTNILLDMKAMEELGMDGEEDVSIVLSGIKFRSALKLLIENAAGHRLGYFVDGGVIIVTSKERADRELSVRIYQVKDIIGDRGTIADLQVVVQNATAPSWNRGGDDMPSMTSFGTLIVIRQTQSAHDEITSLLNALGEEAPAKLENSVQKSLPLR